MCYYTSNTGLTSCTSYVTTDWKNPIVSNRDIVCTFPWSTSSNTADASINIIGTNISNCNVSLDPCTPGRFPGDYSNAVCNWVGTSYTTRNITCNSGYSYDGTLSGIIQLITDQTVTSASCVLLNLCNVYNSPPPNNGVCTWSVTTPNIRTITCDTGFSTNTSKLGATVVIQGSGARQSCDIQLDMCVENGGNPTHGVCAYDSGTPGVRTVTCDDGYSSNNTVAESLRSTLATMLPLLAAF